MEKLKVNGNDKIDRYILKSPRTESETAATSPEGKKVDTLNISNSSVLLTPENSPGKEEITEKEKNAKPHIPHCKKALVNGRDAKVDSSSEKLGNVSKATSAAAESTTLTKQGKRRRQKNKKNKDCVTDSPATKVEKTKSNKKKEVTTSLFQNTLVTDFFPVRRSSRKCKSDVEKDNIEELHCKILSHCEEGLKVVNIEEKGRGVVTQRDFVRGEFVVEYAGDLIDTKTAKRREDFYAKDSKYGCYMYYFSHKGKNYCVDATIESGKLGRLINHSVKGNCHTKVVDIRDTPHLILVASSYLKKGTELLYDYGDRSKTSIESHPWLKS